METDKCPALAKITTIQLNAENIGIHRLKLCIMLTQLYIEYFMFNTKSSDLIAPIENSDGKLIGPFISRDIDDELYLYDKAFFMEEYRPEFMEQSNPYSFEELIIIIANLAKRTTEGQLVIDFSNAVYKIIYDQITLCSDYESKQAKTILAFNDARVFSIGHLKNIVIHEHDYPNEYLLTYCNHHTIEQPLSYITYSHVFVMKYANYEKYKYRVMGSYRCEVISIQISLALMNDSICHGVSCRITQKIFTYILSNPEIFKCDYIYASAWPIVSNILMGKFGFVQLAKNASGNSIFRWYDKKNDDGTYTDLIESEIPDDATGYNTFGLGRWIYTDRPYIYTFKMLT